MFEQAALVFATQPALWAGSMAVLGLLIGSFLNVVIYRLPVMMQRDWEQQAQQILQPQDDTPAEPEPDAMPAQPAFNIVVPRSRCPHCQHQITALENVPVISWLVLRGRCSACRAPISGRYPAIELLTGCASALVALQFGFGFVCLVALLFTWALIVLTFIDFDTQLLPDSITMPLLFGGLLVNAGGAGFTDAASSIYGAVAGYMVLWLVFHAFKAIDGREGLGYGDFKLLGGLGAWFGWLALPLLTVLAAGVGTVVALGLIAARRHQRDVPIAFGPYLAGAGFIVLIWGDPLATLMYGRTL